MLNKPSLNYVQAWALGYWLYLDDRTHWEDKHTELKLQTFNLFPERWGDLYRSDTLGGGGNVSTSTAAPGDIGNAFDGEAELPVTSRDELNEFYESRGEKRRMTGEQASRYQDSLIPSSGPGLGYASGPSFWRADD